jgi:ABC-2 type transport system ATP-binding protein
MLCWSSTASARDAVVTSFDGTPIVTHFYPSPFSDVGAPVPTVLVGPGWATPGYRTPDGNGGDRIGVANLRAAGFNVVTWDPRGFGGSGSVAQFNSPAYEARDVQSLIDYVAAQPEALLDGPNDPRVGMSGSSYGGAIQVVTASIEPRLDALVADLTWHSLIESFARDGNFKTGWLLNLCANGELLGLTDGLTGPTGLQLGSVDQRFRTMCLEGNVTGTLSQASRQWLESLGPGEHVGQIRAPTLLTQGTVDTLLPPGQAIENYDLLRSAGVPVKMLWYCGGHGTCKTPAGDPAKLGQTGLAWLRRWLARDETVSTGPRFEWIDDAGTWRSGPDYPLGAAGSLSAAGSGTLGLVPSLSITLGPISIGTPILNVLKASYESPSEEADVVGEPTLTLTYRGIALPSTTFVYAQVVDAATELVLGDQVTPIPVVLDGAQHTVTRSLEAVAAHVRPTSNLRLELVPSATIYGAQRSIGTITVQGMSSTLPLVDATRSGR